MAMPTMPSVPTMPTMTCYSWRLSVDGTVGGVGVVGILCWEGNANNVISGNNANIGLLFLAPFR
jgi:hypothetical protein